MDDIGDKLMHIMGVVVGDPDCGTSHWIIGCRGGIILAFDSVGKD
jgi:hypothetical protein